MTDNPWSFPETDAEPNEWDQPAEEDWDASTNSSEWDTTSTDWDPPEQDPTGWDTTPSWDEPDETSWDTTAQPQNAGWGDTLNDDPTPERPADQFFTGDFAVTDDEDAEASHTSGLQGKGKVLLFGAGGVLAAIAIVAVLVFGVFGGSSSDAADQDPQPTKTTEEQLPYPAEIKELAPFVDQLGKALNERDADAYYALFSEDSQDHVDKKVAQKAIKALQSGATYETQLKDGSIGGNTATASIELTTTLGSKSVSHRMHVDLVKESGDWKMVVKDSSQ